MVHRMPPHPHQSPHRFQKMPRLNHNLSAQPEVNRSLPQHLRPCHLLQLAGWDL